MKIRSGFVSNSSSSSYLIVGTMFNNIDSFIKATTFNKIKEHLFDNDEELTEENLEEFLEDCDSIGIYEYNDSVIVGKWLGSVDYCNSVCSKEELDSSFKSAQELCDKLFGKHSKHKVTLCGIEADC